MQIESGQRERERRQCLRRENREVNEARQCTNALNAARCTVRLDGAVSVIRSDVNSVGARL